VLVLCLYLALGSVMLAAIGLSAGTNAAAERDYRRSQALGLAEAGVAEARSGAAPHGLRPLGEGGYSWSAGSSAGGRLVVAHGEVTSVSGARVTRTVRALLARSGRGWSVRAWEEGP
jgi:hypothetical protein